jgi:hypothetical protein
MKNMLATLLILAAAVLATEGTGRGRYVLPTRDNVGVYPNAVRQIYEEASFTVDVNDRLVVLEERDETIRVRDSQDRQGWVEARLVKRVAASAVISYDPTELFGHIGDPFAFLVIDGTGPGETPIRLDRSFARALRENTDRETVERRGKGEWSKIEN